MPLVDWGYTPLCISYLQGRSKFNEGNDIKVFTEPEIDYVIEMVKQDFQTYKKTETMLPIYTKAFETLQTLLHEQQMMGMAAKFGKMYSEVTIENTLKLLLRCKLALNSRRVLIEIFDAIDKYEIAVKEVQTKLDQQTNYKLDVTELANIRLMAGRLKEAANKVF